MLHHLPSLLITLATAAAGRGGDDPPTPVDFQRQVRPILSNACFACHGPDAAVRKGGLRLDTEAGARALLPSGKHAVVPGEPAQSAALARVRSDDTRARMPPASTGKRLQPAEIAVLERWVAEGAAYRRHWSLEPPARPQPPAVRETRWPRNPIDAFVLARLEAQGLAPAPPASREQILRRLTLDLTGLPPTLAELDAFLADESDDALASTLRRLLDSPRHAEHMARLWLDLARYGDTHGYHLDNFRHMWPYRDWVIRAYRDNRRFDRFVIEQLAGDLLSGATTDQRVATGFSRCNVTTAEGGLIEEEYLARYAMDRVDTLGTVFLGLSVGCAQCHDHKYDPITQRDYYRLFAFFHNVAEEASDKNEPLPPPVVQVPTAEQARESAELTRRLGEARTELLGPQPELDGRERTWLEASASALRQRWRPLRPSAATAKDGRTLVVDAHGVCRSHGEAPAQDVYEIAGEVAGPVRLLRLEALRDTGLPKGGPGLGHNGNFVLSELEVLAAEAGGVTEAPVRLVDASADWEQSGFPASAAFDGKPDTGWAILPRLADHAAVFTLQDPLAAGVWRLRVRLRFETSHARHAIGALRIAVGADAELGRSTAGAWHLRGPFPAEDYQRAFAVEPAERGVSLVAPQPDEARWAKRPDLIDGRVHELQVPLGSIYLFRRIKSPAARPATIALGSDDGFRLWLNGRRIAERRVERSVAADQDLIDVELQAGSNDVLLEIVNAGGGCGFAWRLAGEATDGWPVALATALALPEPERAEDRRRALRSRFRKANWPRWPEIVARIADLERRQRDLEARIPRTLVMQERAERRPSHFLVRGQYDHKGEPVEPGLPEALGPLVAAEPGRLLTRLDLARWLVDPRHPLTARVVVNRLWQMLFGTGLVRSANDFGAQGDYPTHPELLDWLAAELVQSGWDVRHLLGLLVTSATYGQSAARSEALQARDQPNALLARGARYRLDAETIRDAALFTSGLLVERLGGPSVKPYQPPGVWEAVGYVGSNTRDYVEDQGDSLWRRSLYTFWKRTAPPAAMQVFDAPSRETCTVTRPRTNTPLQALALLNDVQMVEAARALAARVLRQGGRNDDERLAWAFRSVTSRRPGDGELRPLHALLAAQRQRYGRDPQAALRLVEVGKTPPDVALDPAEHAAWTCVASILLNLDETITRG